MSDWNTRPGSWGRPGPRAHRGARDRLPRGPRTLGRHIPFARTLHAKTFIADEDEAWIGSSNLEEGYFTRSRNVGVLMSGSATGARLARWFDALWSSPHRVAVDPDATYPVRKVD